MPELITAIPIVREAIVAMLRIRLVRPEIVKKGKVKPARFEAALGGTAFCIVADRYLVTAFHVLNNGQPRNTQDKFYIFAVPGNGDPAFHFPVISFPLERPDLDLAVIEVGPHSSGIHIPAVPISFTPQRDGTRVITVGFPAPEIAGLNIDAQGNFQSGQFFLKSHANEGIVAAQYTIGGVPAYELNVGWHHGESGGPISTTTTPPAVFSLMQQYRNIQSPHGIVAGPHRGCALYAIRQELTDFGATII